MFVVVVHYCVRGCCLKKHFFKGSSPWAILILNSMFVVRVHYCVQLLPEVTNFQTFLLPFPLLFFLLLSVVLKNVKFPEIYDALLKPIEHRQPNNFSRR